MKAAPSLLLVLMCAWLAKGAPPPKQQELIFDYAGFDYAGVDYASHKEKSPAALPDKEKGLLSLFQRDETATDLPSTSDADLPTCLLCVCITGSVYCEELDIEAIPPLPKETAYLYARFNKIKKISVKDFADIPTLKRIDLTGNVIDEIEDGAFAKLSLLDQLSLADNKLTRLPTLPANLTSFNANNNKIKSKAIKANAFKKMNNLSYLYLAQNSLENVPANLPESLRILHLQLNNITSIGNDTFCKSDNMRYIRTKLDEVRMEGNPVILGKYPNSFTCLKMLPIGSYY